MKKTLFATVSICALLVLGVSAAGAATPTAYANGFETNTSGWYDGAGYGTITREPSGYTNDGGYADGIASAAGSYHARLVGDCTNGHGPGTDCSGPYTFWGGASDTFPAGGFSTSLSIYLDTTWAASHPDVRFDWDSSMSNSSGGFLRDFVFNAGTTPTTYSGTPGFVIGASTNADRANTNPSNTCPSPSAAPNTCRAPVYITTSGWYTFVHRFFDGGSNGLGVEMSILDSSGNMVADWTIYSGDPMSTVGGNGYGWFPNQEIPGLPIDSSYLRVSGQSTVCDGPLAPGTYANVTVPNLATCTLDIGDNILGDVTVGQGSTLIDNGATIDHDLKANNPNGFEVTNAFIGHDLVVQGATGPVAINGSTIGHDLRVKSSHDGVIVDGNHIGHDLVVQSNSPTTEVEDNTALHNAVCQSNTGANYLNNSAGPGDINTCTDTTP